MFVLNWETATPRSRAANADLKDGAREERGWGLAREGESRRFFGFFFFWYEDAKLGGRENINQGAAVTTLPSAGVGYSLHFNLRGLQR